MSVAGGARVDVCEEFSKCVWPLLEREVVQIGTDAESFEARFDFGEGLGFTVFSDEPPIDKLLLASDGVSGEWFPVL